MQNKERREEKYKGINERNIKYLLYFYFSLFFFLLFYFFFFYFLFFSHLEPNNPCLNTLMNQTKDLVLTKERVSEIWGFLDIQHKKK